MTIIRISQAKAINHTEFRLAHDYRPVPMENFRIAKEWADQGLLAPTDVHHLRLIENMMHWIEAKRAADLAAARLTNREVDEYVEKLRNHGPAVPVDAVICG